MEIVAGSGAFQSLQAGALASRATECGWQRRGAVAAFPIMHRMHSISELTFRMAADDVSPLNQAGLQMRTHDRPFRNGEVSIFGRPGTSGFERESDYQKR